LGWFVVFGGGVGVIGLWLGKKNTQKTKKGDRDKRLGEN